MNIKLASIAALTTLLLTGSAMAQGGNPGAHFIENWDENGDGVVILEEVKQKRGDVFYMFDQDEDGMLTAEEYVMFDETREADMATEAEEQSNNGGGGQGKNGGGHGNEQRGAEGMSLEFNDANGDGQVSEEEFVSSADAWFATMDRNGDGELSRADFGRPQ